MNTNPIICDPDSDEAKALIGQRCEFSNYYISFKKEKKFIDILEHIEKQEHPFTPSIGGHWIFIRKAEENLSDRLSAYARAVAYSDLLEEIIAKLRELGE